MNKITRNRPKRGRKADLSELEDQSISPRSGGEIDGSWPALRNLSYRINFIHRLFDRQTKKFLSEHYDMTNAEWYVLGYLAWHSPRTIAAISNESAMYKSQVSHAVTVLVEKGLVLRADDPADKRSPRFRISARGHRLQKKIANWAIERQKQFAAQLAPHQYKALDEALDILAAYVKTTS
jgi:DNA-binding MarR family transcriptional regulator